VMLLASIIAGEVGSSVPQARMLVACQVLEDARRGRSLEQRWNGRGVPGEADIAAAERALRTDYCERVPPFRFLGNRNDLDVWRRLGYVDGDDVLMIVREGPFTVVGVLEETWWDFFKQRSAYMPR